MESGVVRPPVVHRGDNAAIRLGHVWCWYEQHSSMNALSR